MKAILSGQVIINGKDIWKEYSAFLVEDRKGGMENLNAILRPSRVKSDVAVDIREEDGEKYSKILLPRNEARDVTLNFAIYAQTKAEWMRRYTTFISQLKEGRNGWLEIRFPALEITLRVKYKECGKFRSITYLWREGVQAGKFKIKFREPKPIL